MRGMYYILLGVRADAGAAALYKGFQSMALKCHPDRYPAGLRMEAHNGYKRLERAFQVLSDPVLRRVYDQGGEEGLRVYGGGISNTWVKKNEGLIVPTAEAEAEDEKMTKKRTRMTREEYLMGREPQMASIRKRIRRKRGDEWAATRRGENQDQTWIKWDKNLSSRSEENTTRSSTVCVAAKKPCKIN